MDKRQFVRMVFPNLSNSTINNNFEIMYDDYIEKHHIPFWKAMQKWTSGDENVVFHGKDGELIILFDADFSTQKIKQAREIKNYTWFDISTNATWTGTRRY